MITIRTIARNGAIGTGWKITGEGLPFKGMWALLNDGKRCYVTMDKKTLELWENVEEEPIENGVLSDNYSVYYNTKQTPVVTINSDDAEPEDLILLSFTCADNEKINSVKIDNFDVFTYASTKDFSQVAIFGRFNNVDSDIKIYVENIETGYIQIVNIGSEGQVNETKPFIPKVKYDSNIYLKIFKPNVKKKLVVVMPENTRLRAFEDKLIRSGAKEPYEQMFIKENISVEELSEEIQQIPYNRDVFIINLKPLTTSMILRKYIRTESSISTLHTEDSVVNVVKIK